MTFRNDEVKVGGLVIGKTVMANMVASFLSSGVKNRDVFSSLKIGAYERCTKYNNQYQVISISLNEIPKNCSSYAQYIGRIESRLIEDDAQFVFVLDEWDYIFHRDSVAEL